MTVRVRMAPSPTGYFHLGSARTALFNWLFARQEGGTFVLRIEDTDAERDKEEWVEGIQSAMRWLGLDWDEGPYRQSERTALYLAAAERLLADGRAYWCDCIREDVDARKAAGAPPGYDGFCRERGLERDPGRAARFRTPDEGTTVVHDLVRGDPTFEHATIEDFVILRSNGKPMFILANVVDDLDMRISHVVRGEDHLPNTPKYLLLWDALDGGVHPVFAHLPLLVNEKRQKLSKRRDPVALEGYRDEGYLPEAMRNYLALLGWAPKGDREILPLDDLIAEFRLEDVHSSPAFFDVKKLTHVNGEYIRAMPTAEFVERSRPWLEAGTAFPADRLDMATFAAIASDVQTRVETLAQVPGYVDFLFLDAPVDDDASWQKGVAEVEQAVALLDGAIAEYTAATWEAEPLKDALTRLGEAHGLKLGKAQAPIRVAVTGRTVGPPLFESLVALGRERTLARLRAARARLG